VAWCVTATGTLVAFSLQAAAQQPVAPPAGGPDAAVSDPVVTNRAEAAPERPFDLWSRKELTGDWGGARSWLREQGIDVRLKVLDEAMVNMHGGRETRNGHDFGGSYDLDFTFDLEKLLHIQNTIFWIRGKGQWGGDDSDFDREKVGGLFRTNNDAGEEEPIFVDRWRLETRLFDERLAVWFGREELVKYYFDVSEVIGNEDNYFLNRALVINQSIPPAKGLAFFVKWDVTDSAYVQAAVLDAQSEPRQTNFNTAFHDEDWFRFFLETGCRPQLDLGGGSLDGHYRVGLWYDGNEKRQFKDTLGGRLKDTVEHGDWGGYIGFDQQVWRETQDPKNDQGIVVAAKYGYAHGEVNRIEHFWAVGMKWQGMVPERDKDHWGIGVAQGIIADEAERVNPLVDRETVYEFYYSIFVNPWLTVSPDFQYITNTGGDKDDPDTAIAGIRVKMSI
jgi:porin